MTTKKTPEPRSRWWGSATAWTTTLSGSPAAGSSACRLPEAVVTGSTFRMLLIAAPKPPTHRALIVAHAS